jgi:DNA-binding transcriptional ArsR family regulator
LAGPEDRELEVTAHLLQSLGHPLRLRIIRLLAGTRRPLHIKAVAKDLRVDYATVYRHVQALRDSGVVEIYEVGRSRVLELRNPDLLDRIMDVVRLLSGK